MSTINIILTLCSLITLIINGTLYNYINNLAKITQLAKSEPIQFYTKNDKTYTKAIQQFSFIISLKPLIHILNLILIITYLQYINEPTQQLELIIATLISTSIIAFINVYKSKAARFYITFTKHHYAKYNLLLIIHELEHTRNLFEQEHTLAKQQNEEDDDEILTNEMYFLNEYAKLLMHKANPLKIIIDNTNNELDKLIQ